MPAFEVMDLIHTAVYWEAVGIDAYNNPTILAEVGVEIPCRWNADSREVVNPKGAVVTTDGLVIVNQDIAIGSILWLGELADLPDPLTDLVQVIKFNTGDDLKGRHQRRSVDIMKYTDTLPTVSS